MARRSARSRLQDGASPESAPAAAPVIVPPHPIAAPRSSRIWLRSFDSFADRNFRWFFIAMVGQWGPMNMQMLTRGYLVYNLTGSYAALGVVSLVSAIPMLSLSIVGGVLADRVSRKLVLQLGQVASLLLALVMAALLLSDSLRYWHLLVAAVLQGSAMALSMPARQAMIPEIVGSERLMNAVALNAAGMNFMRLTAPALAGLMIDVIGPGWVYILMSGLYGGAVLALIPVRISTTPIVSRRAGGRSRGLDDLRDGFRYVRQQKDVRSILLLTFGLSLLAMPYVQLLPGYVADVFSDRGSVLGLLIAINGAGALLGALVLAGLPARRRGLILIGSAGVIGVGHLTLALSDTVALAAIPLIVIGIGSAGRQAISNVLVQTHTAEAYRGRVMSIYMMQISMMALGAFVVGVLTQWVGPREVFAGLGVLLITSSFVALRLAPNVRRMA